jgi:uncharacterized protein YgiM (DUF1202 family)
MKRLATLYVTLFFGLTIGGCDQMIAETTFGDKYLKQISKSQPISASSQKDAVNATVKAVEKKGWTPKTVDGGKGYILAEYVADIKYTIVARDYTFQLEVRLPDNGKGDANIVITPPAGIVSSKTMEEIANDFIVALNSELAASTKVAVVEKAEKKPPEIVQPRPQSLIQKVEAKPSSADPSQSSPSPPAPASGVKETESQSTLIITATANVRSEPSVKSKLLSKLNKGEKVAKLGVSSTWINVRLSSGSTGWISSKRAKESK